MFCQVVKNHCKIKENIKTLQTYSSTQELQSCHIELKKLKNFINHVVGHIHSIHRPYFAKV